MWNEYGKAWKKLIEKEMEGGPNHKLRSIGYDLQTPGHSFDLKNEGQQT